MGSLSVAPQLPDDADPCGPERVEEERRPRVSSDPSEKRRRSLSAADGPIPAASESVTAPPRTRQPIRDGAGDVSLEEAERRQAAFEKRLKDGADMDEAMWCDVGSKPLHGATTVGPRAASAPSCYQSRKCSSDVCSSVDFVSGVRCLLPHARNQGRPCITQNNL